MKITIIGGSGFVGTRLIDILKKSDFQLQNIDKKQSVFHPEITTIANVLDKNKLALLLQGTDIVILLAAEHRDDVLPISLYYDVNVQGMKNTLEAMEVNGIKRIIFTSSVAVYGLNKKNPDEDYEKDPFNHYGKSKSEAEKLLQEWYKIHSDWNINILRPTVIFGERNRGNVYNLLKQIASGNFLMVGSGKNIKSMSYVGNIVNFMEFLIKNKKEGYNVFNYADKPDFTTNDLVTLVGKVLNKHIPAMHIPVWMGMMGGYCFDLLAIVTRKKLSISSVRIKKFCATTQFDSTKAFNSGFTPTYSLGEGLTKTLEFEFVHEKSDNIIFETE
jgi:nucleoside-diphosphate-sugar epimerase